MDRPSEFTGQNQEALGHTKERIGQFVDAPGLEQEGQAQKVSGQHEQTAAHAAGYLRGATDKVTGGAKEMWGKVTGNEQTQLGGEAQRRQG